VQNEIETKQIQSKRNHSKQNQSKRNETDRNETKRNETKIETRQNENSKPNEMIFFSFRVSDYFRYLDYHYLTATNL
jgi:hypothetical protein